MKRNLSIILAICITTLCSAFALTACNNPTHNYGEWIIEKEATCTKIGSKYHICTDEDCKNVEWEYIPATGHTYSNNYNIKKTEHAPICADCGALGTAEAHTFNNSNICTECTYENGSTIGFMYSLNSDKKSYSIMRVPKTEEEIIIPSTLEGLPVLQLTVSHAVIAPPLKVFIFQTALLLLAATHLRVALHLQV